VVPVAPTRKRQLSTLRRLAAARLASAGIPVEVDIDPLMLAWLDADQVADMHRLRDDLFLPGVRWRFPRDRTGVKLASRTQVLLAQCAPPTHPLGAGIWLVAESPAPRAEQQLTVRLARVGARKAYHRWDAVPEYWRSGTRGIDELWGIGTPSGAALADDVLTALAAGRPLEALDMCGVMVEAGAARLLAGRPESYSRRQWTDKWVQAATLVLLRSAPWRWQTAVADGQRPQRLETLGGYNANRRPGLFLDRFRGRPRLNFQASATPLVLPRALWERDPDHDLVREGLLTRDQIPLR
jgi:hypothetical protein